MVRKRHVKKPPRIPKTFEKRKEELRDAISILDHFIEEFNKTGDVKWVKEIAGKLRALVYYKEKSSFEHPLLIDVAKMKNKRLAVYVSKFAIEREKGSSVIKYEPLFSWGEKMFTLSPENWHEHMPLDKAIKIPYVILGKKKYSLYDIIGYVGNTEAYHYDEGTPPELEELNSGLIYGFPGAYTALYEFATVVSQIAHGFLDYIEND
jgi:hypothetical protein